jgi:hypothetical protein
MTALIILLDYYRERKAQCFACNHIWFMEEVEPEFDPYYSPPFLRCPRCHTRMGVYTFSLLIVDQDEYCET